MRTKITVITFALMLGSCGRYQETQNSQNIIHDESSLASSNSDEIKTCDMPITPKGKFSIGLGVDTLQMCVPGEQIICNAFVVGMTRSLSIQLLDNILGPSINCPVYATMRDKFNIKSKNCDLTNNYTAEIHCVNLTTKKFWIAPNGSFEVQCVATPEVEIINESPYEDYVQYAQE